MRDICVPSVWLTEVDECFIVQVINFCALAFGQLVQKLKWKTAVEEKVPSARILPNPLLAAAFILFNKDLVLISEDVCLTFFEVRL